MSNVRLEHLDGTGTRARLDEIQVVYGAAFPAYDLREHRRRTLPQTESSGFETVTARIDGALAGFVYGLPLSPRSRWWEGTEPALPEDFTAESGDRTFAVIDLAVLPSAQGHGTGRRLMNELLGQRAEQRATLATGAGERQVQEMYERWGWSKVGRAPGAEGETEPWFDLYVIALRPSPDMSISR